MPLFREIDLNKKVLKNVLKSIADAKMTITHAVLHSPICHYSCKLLRSKFATSFLKSARVWVVLAALLTIWQLMTSGDLHE